MCHSISTNEDVQRGSRLAQGPLKLGLWPTRGPHPRKPLEGSSVWLPGLLCPQPQVMDGLLLRLMSYLKLSSSFV